MTPELYFEKGIELYDKGFYLKNKEDIQSIINAMKHFIEANKMLEEYSLLKPKTLYYIALCNYKIGNIGQSFQIAQKAKNIISNTIEQSSIVGATKEMIGGKQIEELINILSEKFHQTINNFDTDNESVDVNQIDLNKVSKYI